MVESTYNYDIFNYAKGMGVKTINQYNWEFLDYGENPSLLKPDLFVAPTLWHYEELPFYNKAYLPVPVNRKVLPFVKRTKIKTILHIAGKELYEDRNGTNIFIESIPYIDPSIEIVILSQHKISCGDFKNVNVYQNDFKNYYEMYNTGDVLVMPRKYGGLCLPLNESSSVGMIPIMTDVSPQSTMLSGINLVKPYKSKILPKLRMPVTSYEVNPVMLAKHINKLAECDEKTIGKYSELSDRYAESISWDKMLPKYIKMMERLVEEK